MCLVSLKNRGYHSLRSLVLRRRKLREQTSSLVHPREVFKAAILANSDGIILSHNHPTGDPTPSREDMEVTKRLVEAGGIVGIEVIDHVVIGDNGKYVSFKERGIFDKATMASD